MKWAASTMKMAPTSSAMPETLVVQGAGVGGVAGQDDLRLVLHGQDADLVHVDQLGVGIDPVGDEVVIEAGEVDR